MIAIVAAHNEADRIGATLTALGEAFDGVALWVADDGSSDGTAAHAAALGATVVRGERRIGKGGAVTGAARAALEGTEPEEIVLLCDADLGKSAARLAALVGALAPPDGAESSGGPESSGGAGSGGGSSGGGSSGGGSSSGGGGSGGGGDADMAVAVFSRRTGGGFGIAVRFARWSIRRRCGLVTKAPLSGQRALRARSLEQLLPFATGYGMEVGMTIDAARAGMRVREIELDLSHRATGRTPAGFLHRGRQLFDCALVYAGSRSRDTDEIRSLDRLRPP